MTAWRPSFTTTSLIALALGFGGGLAAHGLQGGWPLAAATALAPIGTAWTNALRMTVIPLVLANLVLGVAGGGDGRAVGRLGALSLATFALLLVAAGVATALAVPPILAAFPLAATSLGAAGAAGAAPPTAGPPPSFTDWLVGLIPVNPFRAAADGDILALIVFTLSFALALTRIRAELRRPLVEGVRAVSEAMGVLLRWILWLTPLGIFCLTYALAVRAGPGSAGAVGIFVTLDSALLVGFALLLYPLVMAVGRVPMRRFARAVAPAQTVAASTRSSLASLPALVYGAERHLGLPATVTGLVLPLAVATFKLNRTISSTAKLLFLAHVYGIPLEPVQVGTFVATVLLLSFSTPGIPSVGSVQTLPVYLSFGLPIEGVLILGAVDAIPDVFKTVLNVTADMGAAAMVARMAGVRAAPTER